ncbi:MAG: amino acid ABC transporter permease [Spirochaetia bacterium]
MISQKVRFRWLDALIIALLAAFAVFIGYRIKVGLNYKWHWASMPQYLVFRNPDTGRWAANYILQGLFTTLRLSIWAMVLATLIGIVLGVFRTTKSLFLRMVGRTYVEIIRNLPPLVLVFIFYFFVADQIMPLLGLEPFVRSRSPQTQAVLGVLFAPVSRFTQFISAIVTIAVFEGAYIIEIIRAGIESIERGQREAAYVLGLSWLDQMRLIIMPQAIKRILPALAGQFISTIKDSAIVAAISIGELTYQGMQLAASTQFTFEVWLTVALLYLVLTLTLSLGVSRLEKSLRKSD